MSIRVHKKTKFTTISNDLINNKAVSWEARMVLIYLLSKPEGWKIRSSDLVSQSPAGRDKVASILKELGENQYLYRWAEKVDRGRFEWRSEVFESPDDMREWVEEQGGLPISHHHNGKTVNGESASLHNGKTVNGEAVNGRAVNGEGVPLVNLDLTNPDLTKTKLIKTDPEKKDPECAIEIKTCQVEIVREEEQTEAAHPLALDQTGNALTVNGLKKGGDKCSAPGRAALASPVAADMAVKVDRPILPCDDMGGNGYVGFKRKYEGLCEAIEGIYGSEAKVEAAWAVAWHGFEPPKAFWEGLTLYSCQQVKKFQRDGKSFMFGAVRFLESKTWESAIRIDETQQQALKCGVDITDPESVKAATRYSSMMSASAIVEQRIAEKMRLKNA